MVPLLLWIIMHNFLIIMHLCVFVLGMIRGLYLNGMRVLHYVAYQSPYSRIYGDVRWVNSDDIHFDIGDPFIQPEVDPSFDPKMEDCMFRLQIYPPCTSRNKGELSPTPPPSPTRVFVFVFV